MAVSLLMSEISSSRCSQTGLMFTKKQSDRKIVVVTRQTRVDNLRKRFNSIDQAEFFVKKRGGEFADYLAEDSNYKTSLGTLESNILDSGHVQYIDRAFLSNFVFGPEDTVVAIGQDGLVANTLKYLHDGQPLIGVNPDPNRWDGVLLPFTVDQMDEVVSEVIAGNYKSRDVTMAKTTLNDGQEILAVNDFFIGQRTHTSARYIIESAGRRERHSSSGVIVSTGLGSTGWLKSLLHGASAIASEVSGNDAVKNSHQTAFSWDSRKLLFTVREPFPSRFTQADLVFGAITPDSPLKIRSLMSENGVLFSDGVESDFLEFNSGSEALITIAKERGNLVTG